MNVRSDVRCKVQIIEVRKVHGQTTIVMTPVTQGSEENRTFWRATPSGRIELNITNLQAADQFALGDECYVDFSLVRGGE